ncbi:hypothetical protein BDD12DRAFT_816077 [Trichophaea hybrida]|nr:hypothetical protein BDD12DRAFT_816077 [Trichophaea hybrida]
MPYEALRLLMFDNTNSSFLFCTPASTQSWSDHLPPQKTLNCVPASHNISPSPSPPPTYRIASVFHCR